MVKFYRGLYFNYKYDKTTKTGKHLDCIYFATDVGKILMNGIELYRPTIAVKAKIMLNKIKKITQCAFCLTLRNSKWVFILKIE